MVVAVDFTKLKEIHSKISIAPKYFKSVETLLRLVRKNEVKDELVTYILDKNNRIKPETSNEMTTLKVVARNPSALAPGIYNEWLIDVGDVIKIYGRDAFNSLTDESFSPHEKLTKIRAIPITAEIIAIFKKYQAVDATNDIHISPPWGGEMIASEGDFLTDGGYSISQNDMRAYLPYDEEIQSRPSESQPRLFNGNTSSPKLYSRCRTESTSQAPFSDISRTSITRSSISSISSLYSPGSPMPKKERSPASADSLNFRLDAEDDEEATNVQTMASLSPT